MDGQKSVGSLNIATKRPIDDEAKLRTINMRREQLSTNNKQPAQDRLKRLQTKLKQVNNKKPEKDRIAVKKTNRNSSSNSPNTNVSNNNQQFQVKTLVETSIPESNRYAEKLRTWSYVDKPKIGQPYESVNSSASGFNKSRTIPNPFANRGSSRNAWAKPKALLDASNRLEVNRSTSANQRLALLRESLQQKHKESISTMNTNNNTTNTNNNSNNNQLMKLPAETAPKIIKPEKTINFPNNNLSTDEMEPMDIDCDQQEEVTTNSTVVGLNGSTTVSTKEEHSDRPLLEWISSEQELPKRLEDHMYFVLDTNVLMNNLAFVEDLSRVALGETSGSMLFIPYIVIKELDKLKDRRSEDSLKRTAAIRAIHYLNNKFDDSLKIQAQSALEEAEHLIEVDSADDSIVNCCLQLMAQVPNLMLLTNDANLRLKANASSILVSCRSDLLNDYREKFDALPV
ncbi:probable serine/threonine-protein kinase DDB_G0272254 [Drosophila innubila]|uniref:probable serine/threonine-protein kinase DDB_G0272254 n=1 Tax=Drosophila innubila TaxID=198719 RepID=UPI00148E6A2D|nr:probable serine/threonine-protein kinase DDB_G0272254 [Drosophila innubila]